MASFRKVIVSGSNAQLNGLFVTNAVTASGGFSGSLSGTASFAVSASYAPGSSGDFLGSGFSGGGSTGSILDDTQILIGREVEFRTKPNADSFRSGLFWNRFFPQGGRIFTHISGAFVFYAGEPSSSAITPFFQSNGEERYFEFGAQANAESTRTRNYLRAESGQIIMAAASSSVDNSISVSKAAITVATNNPNPLGIVYSADYNATIISNDRSIPDIGTIKNYLTSSYAKTSSYFSEIKNFGLTIDGGGSVISTGIKGDITIPFNGAITGWYLTADQVGSIVIDVWKDTFANFPPTVADSIAGTEKPTLASALSGSDLSLTTWTSSISSGDVVRFNVDSVSTVTRVNLVIKCLT